MPEIFFNVDSLARKQFVRLAPHGTFLESGHQGVTQEWRTIPPLKAHHLPPHSAWIHYHFDNVDLRVHSSTAVFSIAGKDLWVTDASHFAGTPKLKVTSGADGGASMVLSGARFPGTDIPADLTATIHKVGTQWRLDLAFAWGGFQAETDLADWLQGSAQARSTLLEVRDIITVGAQKRLTVASETSDAWFFPCWGFWIAGGASLEGFDSQVSRPTLAVNLLTAGMPGLLLNPSLRRTMITLGLPNSQPLVSLPLKSEAGLDWQLADSIGAFSAFQVEASEESNGHVRRLLAAYQIDSTGSAPPIYFEPGADLLQDDGQPFSLQLYAPCFLVLWDSAESGVSSALLGVLSTRMTWLHTRTASLSIGQGRYPIFLLLELGSRTFIGHPVPMAQGKYGLRLALKAVAARPGEGLIANPTPTGTKDVILSLGVPDIVPEPKETLVRLDGTPAARITFSTDWWSFFARHTDLLALFFHYSNLRLSAQGSQPPRLVRTGTVPGTVVVYFPPQSVGEAVTDESAMPVTPPPGPVAAMISGLSRLAFSVSDGEVPFDVPTLFDWVRKASEPPAVILEAKLAPAALAPPAVVLPDPLVEPLQDQTAIEAPFDLVLSPDQHGRWEGERHAVVKDDRAELWHVRLEKQGGGTPALRGLWTSGGNPIDTPLRGDDRKDIVYQSSSTPVDANRMMLSALGAWLDLNGQWDADLESWRHVATLGRDHYVRTVHRGYLLPYGHKVVYIEISERKFQERLLGFKEAMLFKRRLIFVREPVRDFPLPGDGTTDEAGSLRRFMPFDRVEIMNRMSPILEPPEKTAQCVVLANPDDVERPHAFWPMVATPQGVRDVLFHIKATDRDSNVAEYDTPMVFVRGPRVGADVPDNQKELESAYALMVDQVLINSQLKEQTVIPDPILDATTPPPRYVRPLGGQVLTFVPRRGGTDDTSSAEAAALAFRTRYRGVNYPDDSHAGEDRGHVFAPLLAEARVMLPVMRTLGQVPDAVRVLYAGQYVDQGLGGGNAGQVFLQMVKGKGMGFDSGNRPDKVGALASPNMNICGVSRTLGAVGATPSGDRVQPADLDKLSQGTFEPSTYFPDAKLLGFISLKDILGTIPGFAGDSGPTVPRWVEGLDGTGKTYNLKWTTQNIHSCMPFEVLSGTELSVDVAASVKASGSAESTVTATLGPFALNLADVIRVEFTSLAFEVPAGSKPLVHVNVKNPDGVTFAGALAFVQKIKDSLGLDHFVDPPYLDVTADGLTCGYTLAVPSISLGAFGLQNLALAAGLNLPFTGAPPRVRFAISERQNPFIVTVYIFGGGGFFGIEVGPDGTQLLEVSLEFGGNFSLNLGVASGGVHVMAGIYFKLAGEQATLTGYVRAGGSLEVLGLISVSVEFYLGLTYEPAPANRAWGEASMTVEVEVLFFSASVTLTVRREFAGGSEDLAFDKMISPSDWSDYLAAFADEEVIA